MSINVIVYVGPYLEIDGLYNCENFEHVVHGVTLGDKTYCLPNRKLVGIKDRVFRFDRDSGDDITPISDCDLFTEVEVFHNCCSYVIQELQITQRKFKFSWGVVPYWL